MCVLPSFVHGKQIHQELSKKPLHERDYDFASALLHSADETPPEEERMLAAKRVSVMTASSGLLTGVCRRFLSFCPQGPFLPLRLSLHRMSCIERRCGSIRMASMDPPKGPLSP